MTQNRLTIIAASIFLINIFQTPTYAGDTKSPVLMDFKNIGVVGANDVSKADVAVKAEFIISDESSIQEPKLLLKSNTTNQLTEFAKINIISKIGNLTQFEAVAIIKQGQAAKDWEWVLYPLLDSLGNSSNTFGPVGDWIKSVTVFDKNYTPQMYSAEKMASANINYCLRYVKRLNQLIDIYANLALRSIDNKDLYNKVALLKLKSKVPDNPIDLNVCSDSTLNVEYIRQANEQDGSANAELADVSTQIVAYEATKKAADNFERLRAILKNKIDTFSVKFPYQTQYTNAWNKSLNALPNANENFDYSSKTVVVKNLVVYIDNVTKQILTTKTSLKCIKGNLVKTVTAINPKCPQGYKTK